MRWYTMTQHTMSRTNELRLLQNCSGLPLRRWSSSRSPRRDVGGGGGPSKPTLGSPCSKTCTTATPTPLTLTIWGLANENRVFGYLKVKDVWGIVRHTEASTTANWAATLREPSAYPSVRCKKRKTSSAACCRGKGELMDTCLLNVM